MPANDIPAFFDQEPPADHWSHLEGLTFKGLEVGTIPREFVRWLDKRQPGQHPPLHVTFSEFHMPKSVPDDLWLTSLYKSIRGRCVLELKDVPLTTTVKALPSSQKDALDSFGNRGPVRVFIDEEGILNVAIRLGFYQSRQNVYAVEGGYVGYIATARALIKTKHERGASINIDGDHSSIINTCFTAFIDNFSRTTMESSTEVQRHTCFYMHSVTFLVGIGIVPREPLERESTVFCDMFALPQGDGNNIEGLSDETPIRLLGVSKEDFEQLLKVLFNRRHGRPPCLPDTIEQWMSVLKLSTTWGFEEVRTAAIDALMVSGVSTIDRLVLGRKYDISSREWLLPALNELAQRAEPIGFEEASRMGFDTALKLAAVRERLALSKPQGYYDLDGGYRTQSSERKFVVAASRDISTQRLDFSNQIIATFNLYVLYEEDGFCNPSFSVPKAKYLTERWIPIRKSISPSPPGRPTI
ncbi:hypothetical protein EDC04DRAFT_3091086 [Pisolithus marmoratus]|nr:hypothetical protein EDC04DRAFT_3091086 [Pisolithus marmoratus]